MALVISLLINVCLIVTAIVYRRRWLETEDDRRRARAHAMGMSEVARNNANAARRLRRTVDSMRSDISCLMRLTDSGKDRRTYQALRNILIKLQIR